MFTRAICLAAVILCTSFSGCAGSGNSGGKKQVFKKILGVSGRNKLVETTNQIVFLKNRYLESGYSKDLGSRIEIITEWLPRSTFPDEMALGISAVESKLVIFAKLRRGQGDTYYVTFQAENRVKYQERAPWQKGPITSDAKTYFNDIVDDLFQKLKSPY